MRKTMLVVALIAAMTRTASASAADPQPGNIVSSSMTVAELEKAGDQLRAQKDYKQAMQAYRLALRKESKNAVLYNKLGLAELQGGDARSARSDFERAIKYDKKYAQAQNNLGAVAYLEKKYGNAASYFKKAVALEENQPTFHVNLGAAWFAQNKLERSILEYMRALELDPDALTNLSKAGINAQISTPEERARYFFMVAKIYAKRGNLTECLEFLKKAKEQGYAELSNIYKEQEFAALWQDPRLIEVVPTPTSK